MAVSLVSTGVQFPDSTIQTTAASASPMVLLTTTTASGATSYNLFTSSFSNTYTQYKILYTIIKTTGSDINYNRFRLILDGSQVTTGNVYGGVNTTFNGLNTATFTYASSGSGTADIPYANNAGDSTNDYVTQFGEYDIIFARSNSQRICGWHKYWGTYYANVPYSYYYNYGWANKSSYSTGVTGIYLETNTTNVTVKASLYGIVI